MIFNNMTVPSGNTSAPRGWLRLSLGQRVNCATLFFILHDENTEIPQSVLFHWLEKTTLVQIVMDLAVNRTMVTTVVIK